MAGRPDQVWETSITARVAQFSDEFVAACLPRVAAEHRIPDDSGTTSRGLNDVNGFHVTESDTVAALENAHSGPLQEDNVGGGTLSRTFGPYTAGVLVQCNCGRRAQLQISGVPVGKEIQDSIPYGRNGAFRDADAGSIIVDFYIKNATVNAKKGKVGLKDATSQFCR